MRTFPRYMFRADGTSQLFKSADELEAAEGDWLELPPGYPGADDDDGPLEIDMSALADLPPAETKPNRAVERRKRK